MKGYSKVGVEYLSQQKTSPMCLLTFQIGNDILSLQTPRKRLDLTTKAPALIR